MRKLEFTIEKGRELIELLNRGDKFEVLESLIQGDTVAAYVLGGHTAFTWGHYYRAAFCSISPHGEENIVISISHINIQRAWHGSNLFRSADSKIEDQIADYLSQQIPGGRELSSN